jgi:hypothetical protein
MFLVKSPVNINWFISELVSKCCLSFSIYSANIVIKAQAHSHYLWLVSYSCICHSVHIEKHVSALPEWVLLTWTNSYLSMRQKVVYWVRWVFTEVGFHRSGFSPKWVFTEVGFHWNGFSPNTHKSDLFTEWFFHRKGGFSSLGLFTESTIV